MLQLFQVPSHPVKVVSNDQKGDQWKDHSDKADPDKVIFCCVEASLPLTDRAINLQSDLDESSILEIELLQKVPVIAWVTHINVGRIVDIKAPS